MQACISSTDFDAAFTIMAKLTKIWTRLSQQHNIAKLALTKVILLLAELRSESARAAYNEHLATDGFCARAEAEACEELIIFFGTYIVFAFVCHKGCKKLFNVLFVMNITYLCCVMAILERESLPYSSSSLQNPWTLLA